MDRESKTTFLIFNAYGSMYPDKEFDKKLMQSLKELEDKINSYEDSTQKYDALMALEKIRQLLNLGEE